MTIRYVTIPCYDENVDWQRGTRERRYKLCVRPRSIIGYTVHADGCTVLLSNGDEHLTHATEAELQKYISGELVDSSLNYREQEQWEYHKTYTMQK